MAVAAFFEAHRQRLAATQPLGPVLDLACGRGRHALACARAGLDTVALDLDGAHLHALQQARDAARDASWGRLDCLRADLESGHAIPLRPGSCGAVLVFRFLFRPLAPQIAALLAPGGLLVYETFTRAQRELGFGPRSDAFLLEPGELADLFPELEVQLVEEGLSLDSKPCQTARLLARRR